MFFRLSGTLVGLADNTCGIDSCNYSLSSYALRTGRRIRNYVGSDPGYCTGISALQMSSTGSLVAVQHTGSSTCGYRTAYTVLKVEADDATTLDSGADIDPRSLAIGGGWAYWMRGGQPQSAPIR